MKQSVVRHATSFSWFRREKKKFFISTKYFTKNFVSTKYHTTFVLLNKSSKNIKKEITEEENFPCLTAKSPAAYERNNSYNPPLMRAILLRTSIKKQMDTTRTFNITLSQLITLKQRDDGKKQTLEKA